MRHIFIINPMAGKRGSTKKLEADIRAKADAERYRQQQEAEADLFKRQKDAEAARYEQEQKAEAAYEAGGRTRRRCGAGGRC